MRDAKHGCLVCSGDLVARGGAERTVCAVCGRAAATSARCAAGHAVCDACQAGVARDVVERFCHSTESRDPIEIAVALMRHRAVRLHGPEHRFLTAAALVAANANTRSDHAGKERALAAARAAVERDASGACGCDLKGTSSVAHATGVYADAVAPGRGHAARLAEAALRLVGQIGGGKAPCCKRATFLSILQACQYTRAQLGTDLQAKGPACEWHHRNRDCIRDACPFYRPAAA